MTNGGRIAQITDQARRLSKLSMRSALASLSLSRAGTWYNSVKYKGDGEIENVVSKEGPMVAVQVANIFNTLLDLIAPATAEANL